MIRNRLSLGALVGGLLVLLVDSCAPVDMPVPDGRGPATPGPAAVSQPTPQVPDQLQARILLAIDNVRKRDLRTDNGFWTVFHGILGLGPSLTLVKADSPSKERVNALDYICSGGKVRGMNFEPKIDEKGFKGIDVLGGQMFVAQGHQDQFVAEMVEWNLPPERTFHIGGRDYKFQDFIDWSTLRASTKAEPKQELSWAIIIIAQHKGTDYRWTNERGEELTFEDVLRYELNEDIEHAACGGTHRLYGLTWAYHLHLQRGGKTEGVWADVEAKLAKYKKKAFELKNSDGSFSTEFFRGRAHANDMQRRINTTGHIFEWLALAMSDAELKQGWMQEAANRLALMIIEIQNREMEGGTLYHAVHGLLEYYARVYNTRDLGPNAPHLVLRPAGK
jgi:hypothetical protein